MSDSYNVLFFPNGNVAVFRNGVQIPEMQGSWFRMYVKHIASFGVDPTEVIFTMPDGYARTCDPDDPFWSTQTSQK